MKKQYFQATTAFWTLNLEKDSKLFVVSYEKIEEWFKFIEARSQGNSPFLIKNIIKASFGNVVNLFSFLNINTENGRNLNYFNN